MICKKYKIDNGVLDKIHHNNNSMFLLSKTLTCKYDARLLDQIKAIPQKLSWFGLRDNTPKNSMYSVLFAEERNEL